MGVGVCQFLNYLELERDCSRHTITAYRTDLTQFENVTGCAESLAGVSLLEPDLLDSFADWLQKQRYQEATVGRKIAAVRSYLRFACEQTGVSPAPLLASLDMPRTELSPPETLSSAALTRLLNPFGADPRALRDHAILNLIVETGLRPSNVIELVLDDVDWEHARVRMPDGTVVLHRAFAPLQAYVLQGRPHLVRHPGERALFLNRRGTALSRQALWMMVKQRAQQVGLSDRITPQLLRHTFARNLLQEGLSYRDVQKRMHLSSSHILRLYHKDIER